MIFTQSRGFVWYFLLMSLEGLLLLTKGVIRLIPLEPSKEQSPTDMINMKIIHRRPWSIAQHRRQGEPFGFCEFIHVQ